MYLFTYLLIRLFGWVVSFTPYSILHAFGRVVGGIIYYLYPTFRKKALGNLAIAFPDKPEAWRKRIARRSFANLLITLLEFFRLKKSRHRLEEIVTLSDNPEVEKLMESDQGVIFLTGHQANWEIPFIGVTHHYRGIAIGRPIKNPFLYKWVLSVREMNGGKIVMPKQAIKEGMRALKKGEFLGIVGDQAYPGSPYSYPLFGTRAWTASTPALLAYKTRSPLVIGTTKRAHNHYTVSASKPIWPDTTQPIKEEVPRMMDEAMRLLEESILESPEQWMWVHDRWKQQGVDHVKRLYRFGFILIILPKEAEYLEASLHRLRKIYPRSFFTIFTPKEHSLELPQDVTEIPYSDPRELLVRDYRYQLLIDFSNSRSVQKHFKKLGVFRALDLKKMQKMHPSLRSPEELLLHTLVKPQCLQTATF